MGDGALKNRPVSACTLKVSLGLGFHLTWISAMFFPGTLFDAVAEPRSITWYYIASMLALVLTLLAFAAVPGRWPKDVSLPSLRTAAVFLGAIVVGSMMKCAASLETSLSIACFVVSAALTGVGSAFLDLLWGRMLVNHGDVQPVVALCLAYAFSTAANVALAFLPFALWFASLAVLPICSMATALQIEHASRGVSPQSDDEMEEYRANLSHFAGKLLLSTVFFGIVLSLIQNLVVADGADQSILHRLMYILLEGLPLLAVAMYFATTISVRPIVERTADVYRLAFLAMVAALLITSVTGAPNVVLQDLMHAGYTFFKIVVWAQLCLICRTGLFPAVRMFGLGEAFLTLGLLLSSLAMQLPMLVLSSEAEFNRLLVACCIAVLIATYLFVLPERQLIAVDDFIRPKSSEKPRFRFKDKMDGISIRFGLTPRESEVLMMFVRGRSTARIAEDLCLSSGTVATHLRNIYRKANVHSRQELLDLLDLEASQLK